MPRSPAGTGTPRWSLVASAPARQAREIMRVARGVVLAKAWFAMRTLSISILAVIAFTGCASDTLDDTTYRRLVDTFDSYDQCLAEGDFAPCYQTLTFCADGRANANLEFRQEGPYKLDDSRAIAKLQTATVIFDLETRSSAQLPGRHKWELVEPLSVDCAP